MTLRIILTIQILIALATLVSAQESTSADSDNSGTIKYEAFDKFDLSFFEGSDQKTTEWVSSMPKGIKIAKVLYFDNEVSLFEIDKNAVQPELDKKSNIMVSKMDYIMAPTSKLMKIFLEHSANRKTEQLEFMGRNFIIESGLKQWNWRPGVDQTKILGYTCMSAVSNVGDKIVKAWYAPGIQTWTGPDNFYGLPGLILAVDIDGENVLLATSVDLNNVKKQDITIPDEGKEIDEADFEELFDRKMKEYEEMIKNKSAIKDGAVKKE